MAIISHKVEGVSNDVTHYARVYPVNKKGHAQSELDGQIASALTNAFPAEPSSYNLIGTYSSSQTFTAPEDGWYQIEVFGASGNGGAGSATVSKTVDDDGFTNYNCASGGGGGGGGYASSIVKLNKGDLVLIVIGAVGSDTTVTINPTTDELYEVMTVTSGANGTAGSTTNKSATAGTGGNGGKASGGNVSNITGGVGRNGSTALNKGRYWSEAGGTGGSSAQSGGNTGGKGGAGIYNGSKTAGSGSAGFIKIYRGDTNVVAA